MIRFRFNIILIAGLLVQTVLLAQHYSYTTSSSEFIFSWGQLEYTDAYKASYPQAEILNNPVRFTCFFHLGQNFHFDLSKNLGFFTGYGLRNVGFITNEVLPVESGSSEYFDAKIVRRTYSLGIPLALKIGSMKDRVYVYGGGEVEWAFAYKEKYWDSHSRSGTKSKYSDFMGSQVNPILPSAFMGIQFKKGLNVKLKYYLTDFLNNDYTRKSSGSNQVVSDLTKYKSSQLIYIAISWQVQPKKFIKKEQKSQMAYIL